MKQVLRRGLKEMVVDDVPAPRPGRNQVLVRPHFSLISSGTETASIKTGSLVSELADNPSHISKVLAAMRANGPGRTVREVLAKFSDYAVLGYAGAGEIIDMHPSVRDLEIGARVAYGGEGTGHGEVIATSRQLVAQVPDDLGLDGAAFATLGAIAMNTVRIAQPALGETVAVIGLGLVGQLVCQLARLQGARVFALDLQPARVELALKLGAERGFAGDEGSSEAIRALTDGRGVDCAIVAAAAKSAIPSQLALRLTRDRGRIAVVGAVALEFPWLDMYLKEIQLLMARAYGPGSYDDHYERDGEDYPVAYVRWTENRNMTEFLRLAGNKLVNVNALVSHRFDLDAAPQAYSAIMAPGTDSLAVLLEYSATKGEPATPFPINRRVQLRDPITTPESKIRMGLVGAGNIARWAHMQALQKLDTASLRAVCAASGTRAKSYAKRFDAEYCTTEYSELLNDKDLDAIIIASRNPLHAAQALAALEAGKHVFVEKPMALTEAECVALLDAQRASGCVLQVGFNRRFAPIYKSMKSKLVRRAGPAVISCRVNSPGIGNGFWMADPSIGGAILGEACHFVDLFAWLLDSEPISVGAYRLPKRRSEPFGENNVVASFAYADGSVAALTYCTVGHPKGGGERVEAFAPGVSVAAEDFKTLFTPGAFREKHERLVVNKGYDAQLAAFARAIKGEKVEYPNGYDGSRATIGCLRLLESADNGGKLTLGVPTG
jgi:predicted dehydrogenase/threonine dehydrogenase-like Zn-dependent dehydrogenase